MNKVILIGRIATDIELKATDSGVQYLQFNVACDNGKDKEGNSRDADFVPCVAWDKRAETLSIYVKKGYRIAVEGKYKRDKYQTKEGENRYKDYVLVNGFQFLESKKEEFVPSAPEKTSYTAEEIDTIFDPEDKFASIEVNDSDLPF